jgi:hypothetical protein
MPGNMALFSVNIFAGPKHNIEQSRFLQVAQR